MKTSTTILAVAALFSIAAFSSIAGTAFADPSVIPDRGDGESVTAVQRGQESRVRAITAEVEQLNHNAAVDFRAGRYAQAEVEAQQSLNLKPNAIPAEIFAESLERQGKDQEALQAYKMLTDHYDRSESSLVPYAQFLLKSGQWAQAVTVYNHTLLDTERDDLGRQLPLFSPDVPEPLALETALHLERGNSYNNIRDWVGSQNTAAMEEYNKALQLAPDNALTNYYGVGWQRLTPAERTKFGTAQQARAHLRKAEKVGNANIRAAAAKALKALG